MFLFRNFVRSRSTLVNAAFAAAILAILVSGCSWIDRSTGEANSNAASSPANMAASANAGDTGNSADVVTSGGPCANEYYPIEPAAKREYEIRGSLPGDYTLKQNEPAGAQFTETRTFKSGTELTINWICEPDGLRTAEFINTATMRNANFAMETVSSEGVTIPSEMSVGDEFQSSYDIKANLNAGPVKAAATGKVTVANKVAALDEKVSAAGTEYTAARIDSTIKIELSMGGRSVPGATVTTKNWYAPGVGLVKQETGGTYGKQTVELVAYEK